MMTIYIFFIIFAVLRGKRMRYWLAMRRQCRVHQGRGWKLSVQVQRGLQLGPGARLRGRQRVHKTNGLRCQCEMHQRTGLAQVHMSTGFRRAGPFTLRK